MSAGRAIALLLLGAGLRAPAQDALDPLGAALAQGDSARAVALASALVEECRVEQPGELADFLTKLAIRVSVLEEPAAQELVGTLLRRAVELLTSSAHDPPALAYTLGLLANLEFTRGAYVEAERHDRRALALWIESRGRDHRDTLGSRWSLAQDLAKQARLEEAGRLYQENVTLLRPLSGDRSGELADALGHLAENLRARNYYREAEALFLEGLSLGPGDRSTLLNNLAGLYRDQNRYAEALWRFTEVLRAMDSDPSASREEWAQVRLNLAEMSRLRGDLEAADGHYERALAEARQVFGSDSPRLGVFLSQRAELDLERGRYGAAEKGFREALALKTRALGNDHPDVAHTLQGLGTTLCRAGASREGEALLERAADLRRKSFGRRHPEYALSLLALADALEAGRATRSRELVGEAIATLEESGAEPRGRAQGLLLRARLLRREGDREEARNDLSRALSILESLRLEAGSHEIQRARFAASYWDSAARMVAWEIEDGRTEAALSWVDRARARSLLDQLEMSHVDLRAGIEPGERERLEEREARLLARLSEDRAALLRRRAEVPFRADPQYFEIEARVVQGERDYSDLYEEIKNASRFWRGRGTTASLTTPVRSLPYRERSSTLLVYSLGAEKSFAFVVGASGMARVFPLEVPDAQARDLDLPAGPLTEDGIRHLLVSDPVAVDRTGLLERLATRPSGRDRRSLTLRLHGLFRLLVPEVVWAAIRSEIEIVVVPDGVLQDLPFEALVTSLVPEARYWLDDGPAVRYAPSRLALAQLELRGDGDPHAPVVSVSHVVYRGRKGEGLPGVAALDRDLVPLPGTGRESEALCAAFTARGRVEILSGLEAEETRVRQALPRGRILHLATHGIVEGGHGEVFAALALAPPVRPESPADDGFLRVHEIYELELQADLAVLSACSSRTGREIRGEGAFALSRAFLAAGAKRVVASLWQVDDDSTAATMAALFRRLADQEARGAPAHYAVDLAEAKRVVRRTAGWGDPYYWAPFVLEGAR